MRYYTLYLYYTVYRAQYQIALRLLGFPSSSVAELFVKLCDCVHPYSVLRNTHNTYKGHNIMCV